MCERVLLQQAGAATAAGCTCLWSLQLQRGWLPIVTLHMLDAFLAIMPCRCLCTCNAVVRAFLVFAAGVIISRNFGEALFVS